MMAWHKDAILEHWHMSTEDRTFAPTLNPFGMLT